MKLDTTFSDHPRDKGFGPTILVVDDEDPQGNLFQIQFEEQIQTQSMRILACGNIPDAIKILSMNEVHVLVLDRHLGTDSNDPHHDGIASIPELSDAQPQTTILMYTGSNDHRDIVRAMRAGAFGYVTKDKIELMTEELKKAVEHSMLKMQALRAETQKRRSKGLEIPGDSEAVNALRRQIANLAKSDAPALLLGESGTGKSTIAELAHELRRQYLHQKERPFEALNMAAIPDELAERELFGNERGAYTGAVDAKPGSVELANGGTLFLDEIGDASLQIQAKLLKVLDKGIYRRLGGTQDRKSEFRLICATNKNLEQLVKEKKFREDLLYRISTITIRVPSLTERPNDIPAIVQSILPRWCLKIGTYIHFENLPKEFIEFLCENVPKGNIRGIEQVLFTLLSNCDKDKNGVPNFTNWKKIFKGSSIKFKETQRSLKSLHLDDILKLPLDVVGDPNFPGFSEFIEVVSYQVFLDAKRKCKKDFEIAKALKVSNGFVSKRLRDFGLSKRGARIDVADFTDAPKPEDGIQMEITHESRSH